MQWSTDTAVPIRYSDALAGEGKLSLADCHTYEAKCSCKICTEVFSPVCRNVFYGFLLWLRGAALAVVSCSINQSASRIFQNIIFKTLQLTGKNNLCNKIYLWQFPTVITSDLQCSDTIWVGSRSRFTLTLMGADEREGGGEASLSRVCPSDCLAVWPSVMVARWL